MASLRDSTRARIGRLIEAAGGLVWLAAVAAIATDRRDDADVIAIQALAAAGTLCGLGLATWQWAVLGRGGRIAVAVAMAGSLAMLGPWLLVLAGLLATIVGTALVAAGRLRGPARAPTLGVPLLIGAIATIGIFPGTMPWLAGAFGLTDPRPEERVNRDAGNWARPVDRLSAAGVAGA